MKAVLVSTALVVLLALACQDGDEAPSTPTSAPTAVSSATSVGPSATPELKEMPRLIFLRPEVGDPGTSSGVIYIAGALSGSDAVQLTPSDVLASYVGLGEREGTAYLYYLAGAETGDSFSLEARDLETGETTTLTSFESNAGRTSRGSLSPDGRYIAFSHDYGIDLLDLESNALRRVISGDRAGCERGPISRCYSYSLPAWSPDGRLLLLTKTYWEGGAAMVVDPFREEPQEMGQPLSAGMSAAVAVWSPTSDAWCGWGRYGGPSGLYLSQRPEWQPRNLLPEYETPDPGDLWRSVTGCVWLDERRIAFTTTTEVLGDDLSQYNTSVSIFDLTTAAVTSLADISVSSPTGFPSNLFVAQETSTLVFSNRADGRPGIVNSTDGTRTNILEAGDVLVAVTQPIALPEKIAPAAR